MCTVENHRILNGNWNLSLNTLNMPTLSSAILNAVKLTELHRPNYPLKWQTIVYIYTTAFNRLKSIRVQYSDTFIYIFSLDTHINGMGIKGLQWASHSCLKLICMFMCMQLNAVCMQMNASECSVYANECKWMQCVCKCITAWCIYIVCMWCVYVACVCVYVHMVYVDIVCMQVYGVYI